MAKQSSGGESSPTVSAQGTSPNDQVLANLAEWVRQLAAAGGIPVALNEVPPVPIDVTQLLNQRPRVTVAFPPCAGELLAHLRSGGSDEVSGFFRQYFKFQRHRTLGESDTHEDLSAALSAELDPALARCLAPPLVGAAAAASTSVPWPSDCCICTPCVTLDGYRNGPTQPHQTQPSLKRLFIGDVLWLFYFERMGIHQIMGAILDAFACNGRLPISNGSLDPSVRDDITALVLEVMVRQVKTGMSSTVRDRTFLYRGTVGWVSDNGRKLAVDSEVNSGFNTLFHKFIFLALEYYRDRRLAVAIQGTAAGGAGRVSAATLVAISETLELLKKRFEAFAYGRNYYNLLSGIVWVIASLGVLRALTNTLGIPGTMGDPHEYVPAAYDLLVLKRPVTSGETNRYIVHRDCAQNGRDILLDIEVIQHQDTNSGGDLQRWLIQIEGKVEAYRSAYRAITGVDLGASATPVIEQQA